MDYNIEQLLSNVIGYVPVSLPESSSLGTNRSKTHANKGSALYKKDIQGRYYFMPVAFLYKGKEYEIECAAISITGKKNIVSTPLVGRKGSVKELISLEDFSIHIAGIIIGEDKQWPEDKLDKINELYNINDALEIKCALTDIFLTEGDKVIIQDISIPKMQQIEHVQIIEMNCLTDKPLELTIK